MRACGVKEEMLIFDVIFFSWFGNAYALLPACRVAVTVGSPNSETPRRGLCVSRERKKAGKCQTKITPNCLCFEVFATSFNSGEIWSQRPLSPPQLPRTAKFQVLM